MPAFRFIWSRCWT